MHNFINLGNRYNSIYFFYLSRNVTNFIEKKKKTFKVMSYDLLIQSNNLIKKIKEIISKYF